MKVLLIIEAAGGGTGRHVVDLARALHADGHDVHVVYSPVRAESVFVRELRDSDGLQIATVRMHRGPHPADLVSLIQLRRYVKKHGPFHVIHGHSSKAGALVRLLKLTMIGKAATVYTPHAIRTLDPTQSRISRILWKSIEKVLGRCLTDALITVSPDEFAHIQHHRIVDASRAHLVLNGLAASPPDNRDNVRQRFGIGSDELVFGFVARFSHQKAPEVVIRAFSKLSSIHPQARLVMLGFGQQEGMVRAVIATEGIADRVIVRTRESGFECMCGFDVFVMPSRYEGMPYVLLEAAACGLPIIATDVGGVSAVVQDGDNGYIIQVDNTEQLAGAMLNLAANPVRRKEMQDNAGRKANDFSADRMSMETIQIYRECGQSANTVSSPPSTPSKLSQSNAPARENMGAKS